MEPVYTGQALYKALQAEGFELPPNCGDIELLIPVSGVIRLVYSEIVRGDRLALVGRAMQRLAAESKNKKADE
jgi:hypothetical protein